MFSNKITQRITVGFGAAIAGLAVSTSIFAGVASAEPIGPDGPAAKPGFCPIVNTDDNGNQTVEYVPKGSRSGLQYCGADGEWHTGILITEMSPTGGGPAQPTKPPVVVKTAPVVSARQ
jgi:hypothetical protein